MRSTRYISERYGVVVTLAHIKSARRSWQADKDWEAGREERAKKRVEEEGRREVLTKWPKTAEMDRRLVRAFLGDDEVYEPSVLWDRELSSQSSWWWQDDDWGNWWTTRDEPLPTEAQAMRIMREMYCDPPPKPDDSLDDYVPTAEEAERLARLFLGDRSLPNPRQSDNL